MVPSGKLWHIRDWFPERLLRLIVLQLDPDGGYTRGKITIKFVWNIADEKTKK
jgi:hypothetical protein